jgi:cell division protein FtsW
MFKKTKKYFINFFYELDLLIVVPFFVLTILGILMVSSSSQYFASGSISFGIKQAVFTLIAYFTVVFFSLFNPNFILKKNKWIIGFSLVLSFFLLVVLIKGGVATGTGAKGWIHVVGPFYIQPAEFAKILVILLIASTLGFNDKRTVNFQTIKNYGKLPVIVSLIVLSFIGLVLLMPDLGNAIIIAGIGMFVYLTSGIKNKYLILSIIILFILYFSLPLIIDLFSDKLMSSYQFRRLVIFENPWKYSQNESLQLVHSFYALTRGGIFGVGPGQSIIKQSLPEANTDFIIPILVEEFGLVGILVVIALIGTIIFRILFYSYNSKNNYNRMILNGIAAYFFIQVLVNLGGVTSFLPMTGVTFPFISYGGTSMLASAIAIGIALSIIRVEKRAMEKRR